MRPALPSGRSLARLLRRVEVMRLDGTRQHWSLIPPELAGRLKPQVIAMGDGLLTLAAGSDALRMNRVIGLGHRASASEPLIDAIVARYRAAGVKRFSVLAGPGPRQVDLVRALERRGFVRHAGLSLLIRNGRLPAPGAPPGVRVRRARVTDRNLVADILQEVFAIPTSRREWSLAAAAAPGMEQFLARVGSAAAGVGTLRSVGGLAWLGGGATGTRWRRRGVHAALIQARLVRAGRLGCEWIWVETSEARPGRPGGSRRNLLRCGFVEAGVSAVYVWPGR